MVRIFGWLAAGLAWAVDKAAGKLFVFVFLSVVDVGTLAAAVYSWSQGHQFYAVVGCFLLTVALTHILIVAGQQIRLNRMGDFTAREAVWHITHNSAWGDKKLRSLNFRDMAQLEAVYEFDRAARDGQIAVRGRMLSNPAGYVALNKDYWRLAGLLYSSVMGDGNSPGMTERKQFSSPPVELYDGLLVPKENVRRAWRPSPPWLKIEVAVRLLIWRVRIGKDHA